MNGICGHLPGTTCSNCAPRSATLVPWPAPPPDALDRIASALEKLVDLGAQAQRRDHYAENEARQREEAEPEWPEGFDGFRESHDWGLLTCAEKQVVIERWIASQRLTDAEREAKAEKARADFAAVVAAANAARDRARCNEAPVIDYEDIREGMTIEAVYSTGTRLRFVATQGYSADSWTDPSGYFQITAPGTEGLDPERIIRLIDPAPEAECSRCGEVYAGTAEATLEHHRACTGETPENPMGDPLDEDDHRDRADAEGDPRYRNPGGCWHASKRDCTGCVWTLALVNKFYGPLTFARDASPAPQEATQGAAKGKDDTVEGVEPDPLDENDHRDRLARQRLLFGNVRRLTRREKGHWHTEGYKCTDWCPTEDNFSLALWACDAEITFAPDAVEGAEQRPLHQDR